MKLFQLYPEALAHLACKSPPSVQSHLTHRKHSDFRFGAIYYDTSRVP